MATQTFTTPGTESFSLAGKTNVQYQIWGPGGTGAEGDGADAGGGGGGACYAAGTYADTGGGETALSVVVAGATPPGSLSQLICADGDSVGSGVSVPGGESAFDASGAFGGDISNGSDSFTWNTTTHNGGNGATGGILVGGGGGGAAGSNANGSNGSSGTGGAAGTGGGAGGNGGSGVGNGVAGSAPGGGGGGGGVTLGTGAAGANGKIILTWDVATPVNTVAYNAQQTRQ